MDANAYVGEAIAGLVYLIVGVRLFRLSRRTRQLPETLIAASFLLWTLSYALWDIPYLSVGEEDLVDPVYSYGSLVALGSGNVVFCFFIRAVFRPGDRWAGWLVAAIALSLFAGLAGTAWIGDWEGIRPLANPWYWLELFGSFAPSCWMCAEGIAHYRKTRRQLKLALCDPMACNRFLLWGIAGALWAILEGIVTASDLVYAYTGQWSEALGFAIGLFEIVPIALTWLIFFPPPAYRRWVARGAPSRAEGSPPAR